MAAVHKCEQLWLNWNELSYLSDVVGDGASDRKKRLFACACARQSWDRLTIPQARVLVEVVESFADFKASKEQVKEARRATEEIIRETEIRVAKEVWRTTSIPSLYTDAGATAEWTVSDVLDHPEVQVARQLTGITWIAGRLDGIALHQLAWPINPMRHTLGAEDLRVESAMRCAILRDVFGNPFRPVAFDPSWRTDTVASLARGVYESRDFSPMPILADALQDAGCEDDAILSHCRGDGPHVRGCWVVDLVLGKE
jgi:hypothetical protein